MVKMESFWHDLLEHFQIDPDAMEGVKAEADNAVREISSRVGQRNFWQVSQDELRFIYTVSSLLRPEIVVETGVGPGTTSSAFLQAIRNHGGRLYSFDLGVGYGEEKEKMPVGFTVPDELRSNWALTLGDSKKTLPDKLREIGKVNIFFHDSEHTYEHVTFELNTVKPYLTGKWLIIIDNYDWTEAPGDFADKNGLTLLKVVDDLCFIHS